MMEWHPIKRVGFRFAFALLPLLCCELLATFSPLVAYRPFAWFAELYWWISKSVVETLSVHVLGIVPTGTFEGSDSQAAWLHLMWTMIVAAVVAAIWSAFARRREYAWLSDYLRIVVRYSLATAMLVYGLDKVFQVQFWSPSPTDVTQTFGGSSPFGLVWRFVGASGPYMVFSGVMECLGAYMLFWRRTTTLGSILLATVLVNVVMLNFCYGVPVKRLSVTFLALALFLELPDIRRVLDFVLFHRPTAPLELRPFPMSRRYDIARRVVKLLWIVSTTGLITWGMARARAMPLPKLWGVYDVEELRRNDVAAPLVITDAKVWQQVAFGRNFGPSAVIVTVDGERHVFDVDIDEDKGELVLNDADDKKVTLQIKHIDGTHLELRGDYYGEQLDVRLRSRDISQLTLTARGFHWVDDGGFWR